MQKHFQKSSVFLPHCDKESGRYNEIHYSTRKNISLAEHAKVGDRVSHSYDAIDIRRVMSKILP